MNRKTCRSDAPRFVALDFLATIDDAELRHEIRSLLAQMQVLSEARAANLSAGPKDSGDAGAAPGPPDFMGLGEADQPPKERSLYEHFLWRFRQLAAEKAPRKRMWFLLWEAEHDYRERVVPPSEQERLERTALQAHRPTQNSKEEEALAAHIIATTEGIHARKVSLDLRFPQGWIEKVRELGGYEPVMGTPRQPWRTLTIERKRELVAEQQQLGRTQVEAAKALGCGERTIKQYWPRPVAA